MSRTLFLIFLNRIYRKHFWTEIYGSGDDNDGCWEIRWRDEKKQMVKTKSKYLSTLFKEVCLHECDKCLIFSHVHEISEELHSTLACINVYHKIEWLVALIWLACVHNQFKSVIQVNSLIIRYSQFRFFVLYRKKIFNNNLSHSLNHLLFFSKYSCHSYIRN